VERVVQALDNSAGLDVAFDLVIALDCADRQRMGALAGIRCLQDVRLLNIDHHVTNVRFGDLNVVDDAASSTSEIVLHLLDALALPIDGAIATSLLTGIVTDTRGLRTSNVTDDTVAAVLRLMRAGADLSEVARRGLDQRPLAAMRLWGLALGALQLEDRIVWTHVTLDMQREAGYVGRGDAGLSSYLVSAEEADVAVVFVERTDGRIDVGFRAVPGFNVGRIALGFGGGGHALAAGCLLTGPRDDAEARVLRAVRDGV
jgi:phosphoesterase RecJ-like protein